MPPGGRDGERVTEKGIRDYASEHGLTDAELEKFSLKFPSPEVQLDVVVDGYNSAIVPGTVKRSRIHKAWVTVTDNRGHSVRGIGVDVVDEVDGWQEAVPQAADAREAIVNAVRCATGRLLGEEGRECA